MLLYEGSRYDRGRHRARSMNNILSAISFVAYKLRLPMLIHCLESPLVGAFRQGQKWQPTRSQREAIPLPVAVVLRLEQAWPAIAAEERLVLAAVLLMIWSSLRWSDVQRMDLGALTASGGIIKGRCWRSKTSAKGFLFACYACGALATHWGLGLLQDVQELRRQNPVRDFLLSHHGKPLSYTVMLSLLRRCLMVHAGLTASDASKFTLHSLKCTVLSWAEQFGVAAPDRAAQGHHRLVGAESVQKYGRDDVVGQLR